jgi:hypothetical protein
MCVSRVVALSMVMSACVVTAGAQSAPAQPRRGPAVDALVQAAVQPTDAQGGVHAAEPKIPLRASGLPTLEAAPAVAAVRVFPAGDKSTPRVTIAKIAPGNSVCYAIRSYNFTPDADAPRMTGSSTCQPSTVQTRNATGPAVVKVR